MIDHETKSAALWAVIVATTVYSTAWMITITKPKQPRELEGDVYQVSWESHGTTFVRRRDGGNLIGDIERRRSDLPCRLVDKQQHTGGYDAADVTRRID